MQGDSNNFMDNFTYHYNPSTNQLNYVSDAIAPSNNSDDLDSQNVDNYQYDSLGQLTQEIQDGHTISYKYNVRGLVTAISKDGYPYMNIHYNDKGYRVRKEVTNNNGLSWGETYYVRDASGKTMAIYEGSYSSQLSIMRIKDYPIYGNSRLGLYNRKHHSADYELTDHLGNVRAVVSSSNAITNASDYYPFGMPMPIRNLEGLYRYKFQGQEKDPETGKEAFQLRLWDGRIGRWLTTDPAGQYASPYLGMGNDPVNGIDPDGGYKTRFFAYLAWLGGGLQGSVDHIGGEGNHNYAITTTSSFDAGDGNTGSFINVKFGSDGNRIDNFVNSLPTPYVDLNVKATIGVGAKFKTPFGGSIGGSFFDVEIGQFGYSSSDGGYSEWGEKGVYHNYFTADFKLFDKKLGVGGKYDYVHDGTKPYNDQGSHHWDVHAGPAAKWGPDLPDPLSGGTFSAKVKASNPNSITISGGVKFLYGADVNLTFGFK
jgi:RHS repeat-associated protein